MLRMQKEERKKVSQGLNAERFCWVDVPKSVPQRLKPSSAQAICGTAKPVPFVKSLFPICLKPSPPESVWHGYNKAVIYGAAEAVPFVR
jgi:hypothetical protein